MRSSKNLFEQALKQKNGQERISGLKEAIETITILNAKSYSELTEKERETLFYSKINESYNSSHGIESRTPIMDAAGMGDDTALKMLIAAGGDCNKMVDGKSALGVAAENNQLRCANILLENKAEINPKREENDNTPLILATRKGSIDNVRLLLEHKANIDDRGYKDMTPLMWAALNNHPECFDVLIKAGANIQLEDAEGETALTYATARNNHFHVQSLIDKKANLNTAHHASKMTAVMIAADRGYPTCVNILIKAGADLNLRDYAGRTALILTVLKKDDADRQKCNKLLIEAKADLSPLLYLALAQNNASDFKKAMKKGADIYANDEKEGTTLIYAAALGNIEILKILLKKQAEDKKTVDQYLDSRDEQGCTAMMYAVSTANLEVFDLLIRAHANVNLPADGMTAVMLAAEKNDTRILTKLIKAKADLTAKDNEGNDALMHATQSKNSKCEEIIKKALKSKQQTTGKYSLNRLFKLKKSSTAKSATVEDHKDNKLTNKF